MMKALALCAMFAIGVAMLLAGTTCRTEDSYHCVWIGPLQGNHKGNIVINGTDDWVSIQLPTLGE